MVAHPACDAAMLQQLQPQVGKYPKTLKRHAPICTLSPHISFPRPSYLREIRVPRRPSSRAAALLQRPRPDVVELSGVPQVGCGSNPVSTSAAFVFNNPKETHTRDTEPLFQSTPCPALQVMTLVGIFVNCRGKKYTPEIEQVRASLPCPIWAECPLSNLGGMSALLGLAPQRGADPIEIVRLCSAGPEQLI